MNYIKNILNNKIVKSSIVLINGTIVSQIINFIISPIISRIYNPTDFGNYSNIVAIVAITSIIVTLKYELAIMDKDNDLHKAKNTYYLSIISTIFLCLLIFLMGTIIAIFDLKVISMTIIKSATISIITLFTAINVILCMWLNRRGDYKIIRNNKILYSVVYAITTITFGFLKFGYTGLIISLILSNISETIYTYYVLWNKTDFKKYKFDKEEIVYQAKKYINFPKYQMPSLLLNSASTQLPVIIFTNLISATVSGLYSLSIKIINLPMSIIGKALGDIYFKEASELKSQKNYNRLKEFTYNTYKKLLIIGIIPIGILIGYGDILFKFVFGNEWYMAGVYSMILGPWYYMVFVTSPLSHLFIIFNKQKNNLILNIIILISRILSIIFGMIVFGKESIMVIVIFGMIGFIIWTIANGYVLKIAGIKIKKSIPISLSVLTIGTIIISLPRIIVNII